MLDGKCIDLAVFESAASAALYVTVEDADAEKQVLVSGRPADLYLGTEGRSSALIWTDDEKSLAFALFTGSEITEEEMLRIAESVRPALTPEQPHRPAWVPPEYVRFGRSGGYRKLELHYGKETGEQILFRYWAAGFGGSLPDEMQEAVNGLTPQDVLVNGLAARLYADAGGASHLIWHGRGIGRRLLDHGPSDRRGADKNSEERRKHKAGRLTAFRRGEGRNYGEI